MDRNVLTMVFKFTVIEKGATPGILKRELRRILKDCWQFVGEYWHSNYRAKHFTQAGATEYGYTKRRGEDMRGQKGFWRSYTGRKLRKYGHTYPLVWTGQSEQRTRLRNVRATSNGVRVVMNAPTFNRKNPTSSINMRDEMTRISTAEQRTLIAIFKARLGMMIGMLKMQRKAA